MGTGNLTASWLDPVCIGTTAEQYADATGEHLDEVWASRLCKHQMGDFFRKTDTGTSRKLSLAQLTNLDLQDAESSAVFLSSMTGLGGRYTSRC
ncbi:hypothetical protein DPEC_G00175430 [Dallia pectoralis]|uniref:Uncharacterized protein n=1 Tax=Dallia pectoralis TaxID=75939 RepID=A0ACC2GES3_DALPE|nr:hypothetical protein DPEC_G00175430 [Dallia pectoralis]